MQRTEDVDCIALRRFNYLLLDILMNRPGTTYEQANRLEKSTYDSTVHMNRVPYRVSTDTITLNPTPLPMLAPCYNQAQLIRND